MSALLKKYKILIIFLAFFNPEFDNCMIHFAIFLLKCNEQHSSISKNQIKHWQRSNKETMLDLQTCKITDSVVEKTMTTSWLRYELCLYNQIWCRNSFYKGTGVCQISLSYLSSNIVFQRRRGRIHSCSDIERQKIQLTLVEL